VPQRRSELLQASLDYAFLAAKRRKKCQLALAANKQLAPFDPIPVNWRQAGCTVVTDADYFDAHALLLSTCFCFIPAAVRPLISR
jgi:hypothetical protein